MDYNGKHFLSSREFVYNFFLQRSERRLRIINVISCFKKASLLLKKTYLEEIVPSVLVKSYLFISNRLYCLILVCLLEQEVTNY